MARAIETIFFRPVVHRAGSVRAGAAEGDIDVVGGAEEDARFDVGGISEDFEAADGDVAGLGYDARRIGFRPASQKDDNAGSKRGEAGHGEELSEFAASGVCVFL